LQPGPAAADSMVSRQPAYCSCSSSKLRRLLGVSPPPPSLQEQCSTWSSSWPLTPVPCSPPPCTWPPSSASTAARWHPPAVALPGRPAGPGGELPGGHAGGAGGGGERQGGCGELPGTAVIREQVGVALGTRQTLCTLGTLGIRGPHLW
jgi:hypothetical protein